MAAVQFYGMENVMSAAENLECPAWGIFINRSLFTKYEGDDLTTSLQFLQKNLEALQPSGTAAIYTLKFFEQQPGSKLKITEKSVCDAGSFNFKLIEPEEREMRAIGNSSQYGVIAEMRKEMQEMRQLIMEMSEPIEDSEPETLGSVLLDAVKNPQQLMDLLNVGKMLLGIPVQQQPVHAIGNINSAAAQQQQPQEYSEETIVRLQTAVATLEKNDPKLVEHLEKLAAMSETDKGTFSFLLSMLDKK